MAFKDEALTKLTTTLASDIELYNEVIQHEQELSEQITKKDEDVTSLTNKLADSEAREQRYLEQISNLLGKIPVGETQQTVSFEQKVQTVKETGWKK